MDPKPPLWTPRSGDGGMSPLHFAVYSQDLAAVKACVEAGLDVNEKDDGGWTPIIWCIDMAATAPIGGAEAIVDYLLAHGARLEFQDDDYPNILAFARSRDPGIAGHLKKLLAR
jgi:ankyrin repeat protein